MAVSLAVSPYGYYKMFSHALGKKIWVKWLTLCPCSSQGILGLEPEAEDVAAAIKAWVIVKGHM